MGLRAVRAPRTAAPGTVRLSRTALSLLLLLGAGAALLTVATRWGVALSPDSAAYVGAARQWRAGLGLTLPATPGAPPLTHYPPLYPLLLASGPPLLMARVSAILLLLASALLVAAMGRRAGGGAGTVLAAAALMLFSPDLLWAHAHLWSEPLFIALTLAALARMQPLARYGSGALRPGAALLLGLAAATRYLGAAWIAALVVWSLLEPGPRRERLCQATLRGAIGMVPLLLWLGRGSLVAGDVAANRRLAFHPPTLSHLAGLLETSGGWLLPVGVAYPFRILLGIALLLLCLTLLPRLVRSAGRDRWSRLLLLMLLAYGTTLLLSMTLADAHTPLDRRLLLPPYVLTLLLALTVPRRRAVFRSAPVGAFAGLYLLLVVVGGIRQAGALAVSGAGYSGPRWAASEIVAAVRALPPALPISSNGPDAIYLLTGRAATPLPERVDTISRTVDPDYAATLRAHGRSVAAAGGVIVYLDGVAWRRQMPDEAELQAAIPLQPLVERGDGTIFRVTVP